MQWSITTYTKANDALASTIKGKTGHRRPLSAKGQVAMAEQELGPGSQPHHSDQEFLALRALLAEICGRAQIQVTVVDLEVLELLLAGQNVAETVREMDLPIGEVIKSRELWARACAFAARELETGDSPGGQLLT